MLGRILVLGILLPLAASAGQGTAIDEVHIRGTRRTVDLGVKAGQRLDRKQVVADVRRLWATGWFHDIRAEVIETDSGVQLIFTFVDGPRLRLRWIEFDPPREKRSITLEPGTPIDSIVADRVATELQRQLIEEGYAEAEVKGEVIPVGVQQADLRLRVMRGRKLRVAEVRFSGDLGIEEQELRPVLQATRIRRFFPGIPGLWKGWRSLPAFSKTRIEGDLQRLRSLYLSRGYFDADVRLAEVDHGGGKAKINIAVESGPEYGVHEIRVRRAEAADERIPGEPGVFQAKKLCRCLLQAQRKADTEGRLDFAVSMEARITPGSSRQERSRGREGTGSRNRADRGNDDPEKDEWVSLTAKVDPGPVFTVGRIEFRGNTSIEDSTLRRAFLLDEGDVFDRRQLRRSVAQLNRLGFFEPLGENEVELTPGGDRQVDVTLAIKEQRRGQWSLAGPLGPISWFGPLQLSVGSRLPGWGRGLVDLSTYYAGFGVFSWTQPVLRAFSLESETRWQPLFAVSRPYMPGQSWRSGFTLSPQLGRRGMLASYGLTHLSRAVRSTLEPDPGASPGLAIPVEWVTEGGDPQSPIGHSPGALLCPGPQPRWKLARSVVATALGWLLAAGPM